MDVVLESTNLKILPLCLCVLYFGSQNRFWKLVELFVVPAQPSEYIGAVIWRSVLVAEKGNAGDADDAAHQERNGVRLVEHVQRDLVHLAVIHRSACVCHKLAINDYLGEGSTIESL